MVGGAVGSAALAVVELAGGLAGAGIEAGLGSLWNVITVSLRQAIIPDHLLGRVNSVYRFLGWGMMPIGAGRRSRRGARRSGDGARLALRLPFVIAVVGNLLLFAFGSRRADRRIEAAARLGGPSPAAV